MKILILTSSQEGSAAHHLPYLAKHSGCEIAAVILNQGELTDKKKYYGRKIKKIAKIGIFGTLNGMRMRKWYNEDLKKYVNIKNIKDLCAELDIPMYETPAINCDSTQLLFEQTEAELGLSLGNAYIQEKIFTIPRYGMLNIHHEVLPDYQNAQSIIWQLYNKSKYTGYTIHKIDKNIDNGEIIFQQKVPIKFKKSLSDTVTSTLALLLEKSAKSLLHVLNNFDELYADATPQGKGNTYTTPTLRQYWQIHKNFRLLKNGLHEH